MFQEVFWFSIGVSLVGLLFKFIFFSRREFQDKIYSTYKDMKKELRNSIRGVHTDQYDNAMEILRKSELGVTECQKLGLLIILNEERARHFIHAIILLSTTLVTVLISLYVTIYGAIAGGVMGGASGIAATISANENLTKTAFEKLTTVEKEHYEKQYEEVKENINSYLTNLKNTFDKTSEEMYPNLLKTLVIVFALFFWLIRRNYNSIRALVILKDIVSKRIEEINKAENRS